MPLLIALTTISCVVVLAECALFARNISHLRSLTRYPVTTPALWPRVSVIVAGRDEADKVADAIASRFREDYPDFEVVFVDDRSSDGTGELAEKAAGGDPRFRLVRVDDLPDGWLGKVHALQRGVELATGDWLLFSDADVRVEPGAIRAAVAYAISGDFDMLAVVPEYDTGSVLVDSLWALFCRTLALAMDPAAVRDPKKKAAIGSGAFNLVRREALERTPGFEHLRLETGDDAALGVMIKQQGGRLDMVDGRGYARVAVYRSVPEFLRGVEKNGSTTAVFPFWALVLGAAALLVIEFAPFSAIAMGMGLGSGWLLALGSVTLLATTATTCAALWVNTRTWAPALLWPIGLVLMTFGILRATWLVHRRGGVVWRDTFYPIEELHAGRRFTF